jgi:hypothetical protein
MSVVPIVSDPLPQQVDIPPDVRRATQALTARMDRIQRVLTSPSALPRVKARAKDELVALSREALALWSLV